MNKSTTVSFVIPTPLYLELKAYSSQKGRSMSWVIKAGLKGILTGKKVTEATLIIQELEQAEAKKNAEEQISLLVDDLLCYPIDPLEFKGKHRNDDGTLNREWRHAAQKNAENRPHKNKIIEEINSLRKKHNLPGRPLTSL
jgi:hypothetical protein